jgi:hypothetical protein
MVVVHEDEHTWGATMARRIIFWLLDVLEVLLAFRFFLLLLSANPASPFVQLIYRLTQPFVTPFTGIFPQPAAGGAEGATPTLLRPITRRLKWPKKVNRVKSAGSIWS